MLKMDEVNKIKKAYRDGKSINEIAEKFNRSWATVKKTIDSSLKKIEDRAHRPNRKKRLVTSEVEEAVKGYLIKEDALGVKRKQRYTAYVIYKELKASGIYTGSRRHLQDVVKDQREKYGQVKKKTFLPLNFPIGTIAQFDHGECDLLINNQRVKGYLFVCSAPGTALRYCQIFPVKSSEAWGEFHERSYKFFGGVFPVSMYDNDCTLIKKIIGDERLQTRFSLALEEHYQTRSRFCNPAAGNEKGSVENGVGYCRRNYLPGLPNFSNWNEVNKALNNNCKNDITTNCHYKTERPLQEVFDEMTLKIEPFFVPYTWHRSKELLVNPLQLVEVDTHRYSVPEKFAGKHVRVNINIFDIEIFSENTRIAQYPRCFGDKQSIFHLDHYLDQLQKKPKAFWDCQAVQDHAFPSELLDIWSLIKKKTPSNKANIKFIEILLLSRRYGYEKLINAVQKALTLEIIDVSAIEKVLPNIEVDSWNCNIDQYSQLEEVNQYD